MKAIQSLTVIAISLGLAGHAWAQGYDTPPPPDDYDLRGPLTDDYGVSPAEISSQQSQQSQQRQQSQQSQAARRVSSPYDSPAQNAPVYESVPTHQTRRHHPPSVQYESSPYDHGHDIHSHGHHEHFTHGTIRGSGYFRYYYQGTYQRVAASIRVRAKSGHVSGIIHTRGHDNRISYLNVEDQDTGRSEVTLIVHNPPSIPGCERSTVKLVGTFAQDRSQTLFYGDVYQMDVHLGHHTCSHGCFHRGKNHNWQYKGGFLFEGKPLY